MSHQGIREMCQIAQDIRTCLICHTKGPEKCVRLYLTHFSGPLVWHIRQVLTSCTIWHISLVPWRDVLDRFYVSDCTGCQNLSNMSHQGTREMCQIVQDVRTCLIRHTKGPEKCGRLYRMSELVPWCDILDRFRHPVQSDTFLWSLGVTY
jgi:hypothetical protein